jgi:ribosome-associated translation inhibitor RaiA
MRVQQHIVNLTDPEKEQYSKYLDNKLKGVTELVKKHYPDMDTAKMDVKMEKINKRTVFKFKYRLELPKARKPISGEGAKHTITECMDEATKKLERNVRDHFKVLARE